MTTSASFTSRLTTSTASGCLRSSAMPRLFRLKSRYAAASPSLWGGQVRDSSPGPVSSTLMTSAPEIGEQRAAPGPRDDAGEIDHTDAVEREGGLGHGAYYTAVGGVYSPPGGDAMELYDVMRTTFSAREFTADPVPDETLFKILDRARFAPSGGNRQGWRVIVVRDRQDARGPGRRDRARGQALRRAGAGGREPVEHHRRHEGGRGHHRAHPAPAPADRAGAQGAGRAGDLRGPEGGGLDGLGARSASA